MNIYASSYRLCVQPARLRELFDGPTNIAVISNALDFSNDLARRDKRVAEELDELSSLGRTSEPVDFRKYFGSSTATRVMLESFAGVWMLGGNIARSETEKLS